MPDPSESIPAVAARRTARPHRSRRATTLAAFVIGALAVAACGGDGSTSGAAEAADPDAGANLDCPALTAELGLVPEGLDLTGATLRVGDQLNVFETTLAAAGQLEEVPYSIEWTTFASGPPLLEALAAGAIDIGMAGDAPPILGAAAGDPVAVAAVSTTDPLDSIVVPAGSDIAAPEDLAGKRIAFVKGSSANDLLLQVLEEAGIDYGDITPVELQPADALGAFGGGDFDAWAVWEPFVTLSEGTVIANGADYGTSYNVQVTTTEVLDDPVQGAVVADYLCRVVKAQAWGTANPDHWLAGFEDSSAGVPADIIEQVVVGIDPVYVAVDDQVVGDFQAEADRFTDSGILDVDVAAAELLDPRFNQLVTRAFAAASEAGP